MAASTPDKPTKTKREAMLASVIFIFANYLERKCLSECSNECDAENVQMYYIDVVANAMVMKLKWVC
jgi:hypothetical protein